MAKIASLNATRPAVNAGNGYIKNEQMFLDRQSIFIVKIKIFLILIVICTFIFYLQPRYCFSPLQTTIFPEVSYALFPTNKNVARSRLHHIWL